MHIAPVMKKALLGCFILVAGCDSKEDTYVTMSSCGTIAAIYDIDGKNSLSFLQPNLKLTGTYDYGAPEKLSDFRSNEKVFYTIKYCSNCFLTKITIIDMKKIEE